jgi:8-oxo-dGTP diphosphatase
MPDVPKQMYVTTDAVAISCVAKQGVRLLLVRRANAPFEGFWALPGGFVDEEEDLPAACAREMEEETGAHPTAMLQVGAWGRPGRDPRGRNVSIVYLVAVRAGAEKPRAGSDALQAQWHLTSALPPLAFDHKDIVAECLDRLRTLISTTHFIFALLPERIRLEDLRDALTATRGELVTAQEALAFLKRARVIKEARATPREGETYRIASAEFLAPLR